MYYIFQKDQNYICLFIHQKSEARVPGCFKWDENTTPYLDKTGKSSKEGLAS